MADVARSTRTKLAGSWTKTDLPSDANQRGSTATPTWIRLPLCVPDGADAMEADEDGAALIDGDGGGETIKPDFDGRSKCTAMSEELVGDTLADAARVVASNEGLYGVVSLAPTEFATKAAKLSPTTTDECRIELIIGLGCHRDRPQ